MDNKTLCEALENTLEVMFPGTSFALTEVGEPCSWSQCFKAETNRGDIFYVKSTPRSRLEAYVTSVLHQYCPDIVPAVLADDLLPEHAWRWFLLENAGDSDHENLPLETAVQAAFVLGRLQSILAQEMTLASLLPHCRADRLQAAALSVCEWAHRTAAPEQRSDLIHLHGTLHRASDFFHHIGENLAYLPPTCVHGDLWSGNIAKYSGSVRIIDWGDALWGVGGASIVNLLLSSGDSLNSGASSVWEAYGRGWEKYLPAGYSQAASTAWLVSSLVVDVEIARCSGGTLEMLPGVLPYLQQLANLSQQ
jgi:hypothetical protein